MANFIVPANTTVNSDATFGPLGPGDFEDVFGSVTNTTLNGVGFAGALQDIENGGSADLTTINGGLQQVFLGSSVTNTTINGGEQDLSGTADTTFINSGMQVVVGPGIAITPP
jgi:autotransporter family porin